jgi:YidC/Oxa1 family membrane protein insertase
MTGRSVEPRYDPIAVTPVFANILQPLVDFFEGILKFFHDTLHLGWGTSIVALTLLIRAILLPVTYKSSKSMIRLQQLAPQMKSMQKKYKEDPQRLQQETMKFYRENQVNPFASCLPMVAQLPVFLSLYYMLRTDLRHDICPDVNAANVANPVPCGHSPESSFLFIPDLTDKATGVVLVVLIILYVGSQLVSTLLMSATADKNQRMIFLALPFFFVAVIWRFPAGLLVYWITTNLWTILQQSIIKKRLGPLREQAMAAAKAHKEEEEAEKAKSGKGKGKADGKSGGGPRALGKLSPKASSSDGGGDNGKSRTNGPPPAPPRRKKKRSGRRR